jgi:hypothetical protein
MNFRTEINPEKQVNSINYRSKTTMIGSCFSDNIGTKFSYFRFNTLSNPFGVIFNPVSIENLIQRSFSNSFFTKDDFIQYNNKWQSLDLHSSFSDIDLKNAINKANNALIKTKEHLLSSSHIIITFGTSWVYRFNKTSKIVANCHKIPQQSFTKELLSIDKIEKSISNIVNTIKKVNTNAIFIFTVSPVRHLKDGFFNNNVSKSHLLSAINKSLLKKEILYFPSYEIVMDDLRDYRFYKKDMLHPNELAIDYIWAKFKIAWINQSDFQLMEKVEAIQKRKKHKAFNPYSKKHIEFQKKLQMDILEIENKYGISF